MPNSDSEELRAELLSLLTFVKTRQETRPARSGRDQILDKQFAVLELSTCVTLTDEEKREYEAKETAHL